MIVQIIFLLNNPIYYMERTIYMNKSWLQNIKDHLRYGDFFHTKPMRTILRNLPNITVATVCISIVLAFTVQIMIVEVKETVFESIRDTKYRLYENYLTSTTSQVNKLVEEGDIDVFSKEDLSVVEKYYTIGAQTLSRYSKFSLIYRDVYKGDISYNVMYNGKEYKIVTVKYGKDIINALFDIDAYNQYLERNRYMDNRLFNLEDMDLNVISKTYPATYKTLTRQKIIITDNITLQPELLDRLDVMTPSNISENNTLNYLDKTYYYSFITLPTYSDYMSLTTGVERKLIFAIMYEEDEIYSDIEIIYDNIEYINVFLKILMVSFILISFLLLIYSRYIYAKKYHR